MNPTCVFCRRWAGSAIVIGFLSLIGVAMCCEVAADASKEPDNRATKREAIRVTKMVEDLVNRNKPPMLVNRRAGRPREVPLFPKDYDWKEEKRVREAVHNLWQDTTVELWEELVRRAQDPRYCHTTWDAGGDAEIYSVGRVCRSLAYGRLSDGFRQHLPSLPPHGCPIHLEYIIKDLSAWRMERKDKILYQLQIEVCEMAIRELPKVNIRLLSEDEKVDARKEIETEIRRLKRTKEPIFREYSGYGAWYGPKLAEQIRQAVEKLSSEDITLGTEK